MAGSEVLSNNQAQHYADLELKNTFYLGYRDLPQILKKYANGTRALDFGCGTGRSTMFMRELGFDVASCDISDEMLNIASKIDPVGRYYKIQDHHLPFQDNAFDCVLSVFVFFTVSSLNELNNIFSEISRVLKPGGIFVFVTGSKYLYIKKYLSYTVSEPGDLKPEDEITIKLNEIGISFKNFYYSDDNYRELIKQAGLELLRFEMPLGTEMENKNWLDEKLFGPYAIYTCKKCI